jgi:hypothetical protein
VVVDGVPPSGAGLPGAAAGLGAQLPAPRRPLLGALRALRCRPQAAPETVEAAQPE